MIIMLSRVRVWMMVHGDCSRLELQIILVATCYVTVTFCSKAWLAGLAVGLQDVP